METKAETEAEATATCPICNADLAARTLADRERHVNACLDASSRPDTDPDCTCPSCSTDLTSLDERARREHVNRCLDIAAAGSGTGSGGASRPDEDDRPDPDPGAQDTCRICGVVLMEMEMTVRVRHFKQCAQRYGVRAKDLVEDRKTEAAANGTSARDAFARLMQRPASASKGVSKLASNANAFDILMKGSRTQSVVESVMPTMSAVHKKRRLSGSTSSSGSGRFSGRFASRSDTTRSYAPPCPAFKKIPGTHPPFIVDGFQYASKALSSVYFLTHYHSDHYGGIRKSFDHGIIYCSPPTAALVQQELGVDAKFLHPVPLNSPIDINGVRVTFLDANHCPGSALILFRLKNGRSYLHVGDFRYHRSMLSYAALRPYLPAPSELGVDAETDAKATPSTSKSPSCRLDGIFLDTTYGEPKYVFPTQQATIEHTLQLVDKHMASSKKVLFLFGSYSIGKERLFMEAAAHTQRKVCVSKNKYKMIATFGWSATKISMLTTEPAATNLHVVPMMELSLEHLSELQQQYRLRYHEIVGFRPTGWTFNQHRSSMSTCQTDATGRLRIYGIPYSEHSSFSELCEFVRVLNPVAIIPTVNCHSDKLVKKQIYLLRQTAFHSIASMWTVQRVSDRSTTKQEEEVDQESVAPRPD